MKKLEKRIRTGDVLQEKRKKEGRYLREVGG